jgi:hypothetical protein
VSGAAQEVDDSTKERAHEASDARTRLGLRNIGLSI